MRGRHGARPVSDGRKSVQTPGILSPKGGSGQSRGASPRGPNKEVERAIENEMDSFDAEFIKANRRYIAEVVAWRLQRDGFIR